MPIRLSKEKISDLLKLSQGGLPLSQEIVVYTTDVFIAGSGPIACVTLDILLTDIC
jgi:hypothetical protein